MNTQTTKHPAGMWLISIIFAVLSFGFGVINSLLVLYITQTLHFRAAAAYTLYAAFVSFLYILPIYSGRISDWFGCKKAFVLGVILEVTAMYFISIPTKTTLYFGLALFITAAAMASPAFFVILGKMYKKNDVRRESAFTISYMFMNFSYLVAYITGAYVEQYVSFSTAFVIAASVSLISLFLFWAGHNYLDPDPSRNIKPRVHVKGPLQFISFIVVAFLPLPLGLVLLRSAALGNWLIIVIGCLVILGVIMMAFKQKEKRARNKLFAFVLLSLVSIGFWALYMLEPSMLTIFVKNNVNREFLGSQIPPSVFTSLDPFYVLVIGFFFSRLWVYLRARNRDISLPGKFTLSIIIMSMGFFLLVPAIASASGGKLNMSWMLLIYFFLTLGEMLISPIGNAMVGRLAPERTEGTLMGAWQVFSGVSAALSAYLAKMAIVPKGGSTAITNPIYSKAFTKIGLFSLSLGVISLLMLPYIKKIMRKER
jgi:proton-dependent oligopeptide transporter, POT family